jgi:plastocyanin
MGGISSRIALGLAVTVAALGGLLGTAGAGPTATGASIVADPTCCTFLPGPYTQDQGQTAVFDNTQTTTYHDVVAFKDGPDGKPLFEVDYTPGGKTALIPGTQYLAAGTYGFYCKLHGTGMSGELTVDSSGNVVARPSVKVSLPAQKLKQVRKSGIKVKVKAVTASSGVFIAAKKGKATLGSKRGLAFKAGQTKTITLPLTKAGRKAIGKAKVVQIKLSASVPFGKPASATKKVR